MEGYIAVIKKYAVSQGRASREEYWMFFLWNIIISFGLSLIDKKFGLQYRFSGSLLSDIYALFIFFPTLGVGIRRLHDIDRSGWWVIVPIANIVFFTFKSTVGDNKYGPHPESVYAYN